MKTCAIHIASGIGNTIQSVPFIVEMKKRYDYVYPYYKSNELSGKAYRSIMLLIGHLFDAEHMPAKVDDIFYSPVEGPKRVGAPKWTEPEYIRWFTMNGMKPPTEFKFPLNIDNNVVGAGLVLWPGCKPNWRSKIWPHWVELAEKYVGKRSIVVVGLKGEGPEFPDSDNIVDVRGEWELDRVAGLIAHSETFVGNEGGISHIAAALGTDTYIIYGGTSPVKNFPPPRRGLHMISLNLPCQPCQFSSKKTWPPAMGCKDMPCLNNLTADIVESYINQSQTLLYGEQGVLNGRLPTMRGTL